MDYLKVNIKSESVDSKPFEDFKKEIMVLQDEITFVKREKSSLENKIKYLETEMVGKNSNKDSNKTIDLLKEQWEKEKKSL